jgi:hypothetical protein
MRRFQENFAGLWYRRSDWQRWLVNQEAFVVVDEFHRSNRWRHALKDAFESGDEKLLPFWLRPAAGRRPAAPVWLLLSATPYNPVELDFQLDHGGASEDVDQDIRKEVRALHREVKATMFGLAALDDIRGRQERERVHAHVEAVSRALETQAEDTISSGPLAVVPVSTGHLGPRSPTKPRFVPRSENLDQDILVVRDFYARVSRAKRGGTCPGYATLAERLVVAGARVSNGGRRIEGFEYSRRTTDAMVRGVPPAQQRLAGLDALLAVTEAALDEGDTVLVFCSHLAACTATAKFLRRNLPDKDVLDAASLRAQELAQAAQDFNTAEGADVFVTTDANSESIDLHRRCRTLVHFELPWTPLRVMQR